MTLDSFKKNFLEIWINNCDLVFKNTFIYFQLCTFPLDECDWTQNKMALPCVIFFVMLVVLEFHAFWVRSECVLKVLFYFLHYFFILFSCKNYLIFLFYSQFVKSSSKSSKFSQKKIFRENSLDKLISLVRNRTQPPLWRQINKINP